MGACGEEGPPGAGPAYLQAVADPPVEDGEVGVQGQQHGRKVHLLVDADDRNQVLKGNKWICSQFLVL